MCGVPSLKQVLGRLQKKHESFAGAGSCMILFQSMCCGCLRGYEVQGLKFKVPILCQQQQHSAGTSEFARVEVISTSRSEYYSIVFHTIPL